MRYFIYLLSSLTKSLIAIVPVLWVSSCQSEKKESKASETFHPVWYVVNASEDKLDKGQCTITKCGLKCLRFYVTDRQQCFNSNDFDPKREKNIIQTEATNWVLTLNFYGSVTQEKFPKTMKDGMKYRSYDDKKGGIPLAFLEEGLAIDPIDAKDVILIISTGIEGKLGVSKSIEKTLRDKKEKGEIKDYKILNTRRAITAHNRHIQEGEKVFTFIHTAG